MSQEKSVVLKLNNPIQFGSEKITEITISKPKGKQMKILLSQKLDGNLYDVLVQCSDKPAPVFDLMEGDDVMRGVEIVTGFLAQSPQIGTK